MTSGYKFLYYDGEWTGCLMDFNPLEMLPDNLSCANNESLIEDFRNNGSLFYNFCQRRCMAEEGYRELAWPFIQPYAKVIYGYIYPILVIGTILTTVPVVAVLTRPYMQSPTNLVLLYMALADLCVALVPFPFTVFFLSMDNFNRLWFAKPSWCWAMHYLYDALPPIFHTIAMWLTVLLAAQRLVYIRWPIKARSYCTPALVVKCTLLIVIASILCNMPKLFYMKEYGIFGSSFVELSSNVEVGSVEPHCIYIHRFWENPHEEIKYDMTPNLYIRAMLFVTLPCLLLLICNYMLIRSINEAQQRRRRLLNSPNSSTSYRPDGGGGGGGGGCDSESKTTQMLSLVVSIYLVVNLPQAILLVFACLTESFAMKWSPNVLRNIVLIGYIDNMLILVSFPVNFFIYCSMSAQFRDTFQKIFCFWRPHPPRRGSRATAQTYTLLHPNNSAVNAGGNGELGSGARGAIPISTVIVQDKDDERLLLMSPSFVVNNGTAAESLQSTVQL